MSSLENVVRPFQRPVVFDTQKIVPSVPASVSPARLKWGAAGALPSPVSAALGLNIAQETYNETSRTLALVTIQDQNNPGNSIVDGRATTINFDKSTAQNTLPSPLIADVDFAFNAFSSEIKAAFGPYNSSASSGGGKSTFTFHPPDN